MSTPRCATPIRCSKRTVVSDAYSPLTRAERLRPFVPSSARSSHNTPRPAPHQAAACARAQSPVPIRGPCQPASRIPPTQHRRCAHTCDAPPAFLAPINPTTCSIPPIRATLWGAEEKWSRGPGIRNEGVGIVAPAELRDIFVPTVREQHLLIDLLQRADCCIDDIAQELRTSVAALTIYLASDDAIEILAQAELANARRGRLAATAQLDKCAHALSLILDGYISDTTIAVRRDTPKTRREDLQHQESARRAATQLFKIANFTPRIFTSQLNRNPTRERGATPASNTTPTPPTPTTPPARLLSPRERGEDRLAAGQTGEGTRASDQPPSSITAPTTPTQSPPRTTPGPSQPQSQPSPAPPRRDPQLAAPASTAPP